jgi:SlyX protein
MSQEARITELELRLTHQDKALADLNDMVTAQWKKLEAMERHLRRMDEELQALDATDVPVTKPPHY